MHQMIMLDSLDSNFIRELGAHNLEVDFLINKDLIKVDLEDSNFLSSKAEVSLTFATKNKNSN